MKKEVEVLDLVVNVKRDSLGRFPKNDITGSQNVNSKGLLMTVVKYVNSNEIYVMFEKYKEVKKTSVGNFKKGLVKSDEWQKEFKLNKVGEVSYNLSGEKMILLKYKGVHNVDVIFPDYNEIVYNVQYGHFKRGEIKSVFTPNVYGKGYIGRREPPIKHIWKTWHGILERALTDRYFAYRNCLVCDEWLNYCNFEKWYLNNFYTSNETLHVDKDVLSKDVKIYSSETCIFLPKTINTYIATTTCRKRDGLPTGIYKENNKFKVIKNFNGRKELRFLSLNEAMQSYLKYKNEHFQSIVDEYSDNVPSHIFKILKNFYFTEQHILPIVGGTK